MKKLLTAVLCLLLVLSMLLAVGCSETTQETEKTDSTASTASQGGDSESSVDPDAEPEATSPVGKWKADFDLADVWNRELADKLNDAVFSNLTITLFFEFDAAGTVTMSADETAYKAVAAKVVDQLIPIVEQKTDKSIEEALAEEGMTKDEWIDEYEENIEELFQSMKGTSLTWEMENNIITMNGDDSSWLEFQGNALTMKVDESKLTEENAAIANLLGSVVFTRVD